MKIAGINFDHFHMGDLLRYAFDHPMAEIVGICDEQPDRMHSAAMNFNIPSHRIFTDYRQCLEEAMPDLVILCPATAKHADWVERVAPFNVHMLVEKPFAASLAESDRMIDAVKASGKKLVIILLIKSKLPKQRFKQRNQRVGFTRNRMVEDRCWITWDMVRL